MWNVDVVTAVLAEWQRSFIAKVFNVVYLALFMIGHKKTFLVSPFLCASNFKPSRPFFTSQSIKSLALHWSNWQKLQCVCRTPAAPVIAACGTAGYYYAKLDSTFVQFVIKLRFYSLQNAYMVCIIGDAACARIKRTGVPALKES
jgi:hypothetical protein